MKRLLPFVILAAGFGLAAVLIVTGPQTVPRPPTVLPPLVRVLSANPTTVQLSSNTHGIVVPRTESELTPEVSGRVLAVSDALVSGGFFSKGQELLSIEPLDYEVALEEARARLARADSDLSNAKKTYSRQLDLARKQSASASQQDDALNRLRIAEATLKEAIARLSRAERDLSRTRIIAPYDGRVRSERVDVGQFVNRGNPIAMIYATDYAEVRLPIRDEELAFLNIPITNSGANGAEQPRVILRAEFAGKSHEWSGNVVRTEGELDPRTRMVNVIVSVSDPYAQDDNHAENRPPLSVGLFVEAEIIGARFDNTVKLPRSSLRERQQIYVVDAENRLRFRDVEVLRIVQDEVFIKSGLNEGDKVCISILSSPVDGMPVRLEGEIDSNVVADASQ
ncbi:MAG TPA: efflux RND transporter periplasmic adaptor subunit [Pseudomonadales bacterium]|jgi:RND family efflux transporter MFP subunit|nr:efflux RND transporter periplasmic adaptor subunit [Pseudomonadales bacterium]